MATLFPGRRNTAVEHEGRAQLTRRPGERRDAQSRDILLQRVISEFREMPCLRLTRPQAERLFGLRSDICQRIITALVADGVLRLDEEGRYSPVN